MSDYIPYNIWLIICMGKQGYSIKDNILYEDSRSEIRMLKNGRNYCTGSSRHVYIRYFFVKDRVDKGEIRLGCCSSELMLADFFTKHLQGQLFSKFRDVLMGYTPLSSLRKHFVNQGACWKS